jgi:hypothetical protein
MPGRIWMIFTMPKVMPCISLPLRASYPSAIISVEEIIHEQVAKVQRSTFELSDLVDMISV